MAYFLSCDWGTSAFRLRLVNTTNLNVIAEALSNKGIAGTFQEWRTSHPANRVDFYLAVISEHIRQLEESQNLKLDQVPVVISGMASASIGMQELPYQELPFALDGSGVKAELLKASVLFPHPVLLISGLKSAHDVMRGEETQLIGMISEAQLPGEQEQVFIFPGTHSKHIWVKEKEAVSFKTYMTGELFALLAQKSILSATVAATKDLKEIAWQESFVRGVKDAGGANLLHAAFRVRTNNLFGLLNPEENYYYLSGLLIGTELQDLMDKDCRINLVAGEGLQKYYATALEAQRLVNQVQTYPAQWVDEAVVRGQYKIYQRLINQL